jgi:hypothetical protein
VERRTCGVALTYHFELAAVRRLAEHIIPQVGTVVVVDNTPVPSLQEPIGAAVRDSTYIPMHGNQGVARGFNAGIQSRFRMIALGLYDGLFGHSGPCRWQRINAEAKLPPA